jgi:hypothetical protein
MISGLGAPRLISALDTQSKILRAIKRNGTMFDDIRSGLEKVRKDSRFLRHIWEICHDGQPSGYVLPAPASRAVATCFIISASSLLDEALGIYIRANFGGESPTLNNKIKYLERLHLLKDAARLHRVRKLRNEYAHKPEAYSNWEEMDEVLSIIEDELRNLRVL